MPKLCPLPEMVDSTVGALFTMGDIDSMASTILEEIKHRELLHKKGLEGRKRVINRFTYEIDADYFIKIYNRI